MILYLKLDYLCNYLRLKDSRDPTPYSEVKRPDIIKTLCDVMLSMTGRDDGQTIHNTRFWIREDQFDVLDKYDWQLVVQQGDLYARLDESPSEIVFIKLAWEK